jgi:TatD DNase family protein
VTDTHAHLDGCEDADAAVAHAREAGVGRIVTIGTGIDSSRAALALAGRHDGVYAVLGIDPHQASSAEAERIDELRELLGHPNVVGVGETGLDNFREHATLADQKRLFDAQLELAGALDLPVVIHSREADEDTAAALAGFEGTVVLHCFSSPGLLNAALDRGYYVSFAGNVTYPKADDLRETAREVPEDRLLVETDSPYLSPQPVRGRPNEPANLVHTVATLAELRGVDASVLAAQTHDNASRAFRLP